MDTDLVKNVPAPGPKPKQTFLKRGEGVQKRVFGPVIRKTRLENETEDVPAKMNANVDITRRDTLVFDDQEQVYTGIKTQHARAVSTPVNASNNDDSDELELVAETTLVGYGPEQGVDFASMW